LSLVSCASSRVHSPIGACTVPSRKNDRSFCLQKSNPSHPSNHSEQSFFREVFFNGASNHFTAIILAGEFFQRQHEKTIISVKIVVPPRNINVSFLWSSVLLYRFSFSQPSTQKVFVLPTRFLFALTRPRPDRAFLSRTRGQSALSVGRDVRT
jgi:hypothetical protein